MFLKLVISDIAAPDCALSSGHSDTRVCLRNTKVDGNRERDSGGKHRVRLCPVLDSRVRLLGAALGFLALEPKASELRLLHRCFDTWRGVGDVVAGMARQGYDLELRRYDGQGWRALFFVAGQAHSIVGATAWEPTPWRAVQRAAWETLKRGEI